jgi:DNA-binding transcriptional LysR family regulator
MDSSVDLRLQLYAVILAEELNFSAAAKRLYVAQPAFSRAIRQLEDQLGATLFRRTSRKVELTDAGQQFVYEARKAVHYANRAVAVIKEPKMQGSEKLVIGYPPQFDARFIRDLSKTKIPGVPVFEIVTQGSFTVEIVSNIQKQIFDAGIILMPQEYPEIANLPKIILGSYHVDAALLPAHPLASKKALQLTDLKGQPLITFNRKRNPALYEWFENRCQSAGFSPNIVREVTDPHEYGAMIFHGEGIGLGAALSTTCPIHRLPDRIVVRPFREPDLVIETALVFGQRFLSGPLKAFVTAAEQCWRKYKPGRAPLAVTA